MNPDHSRIAGQLGYQYFGKMNHLFEDYLLCFWKKLVRNQLFEFVHKRQRYTFYLSCLSVLLTDTFSSTWKNIFEKYCWINHFPLRNKAEWFFFFFNPQIMIFFFKSSNYDFFFPPQNCNCNLICDYFFMVLFPCIFLGGEWMHGIFIHL